MLSKKLTFSLITSLVMLLAVGFAFAAIDTEPEVNLEVTDVSSAKDGQIEVYQAISTTAIGETGVEFGLTGDTTTVTTANVGTAAAIEAINTTALIPDDAGTTNVLEGGVVFFLKITNEGVASLNDSGANVLYDDVTATPLVLADPSPVAAADLHISDLSITQFNKLGIPLVKRILNANSKIEHRSDAVRDGRNFQVTIAPDDIAAGAVFMTVQLPAGAFQHAAPADVRAAHFDKDKSLKSNKKSEVLRLELVKEEPPDGRPMPVSLVRAADTATRGPDQGGSGVFSQAAVSGPFQVKVTFTEEPNGKIEDIIDVKRGKVTRVIKGTPFYVQPDASEGNYTGTAPDIVPLTTGRDRRYHSYLLTITPDLKVGDETVEVAIKSFDDMVLPPKRWTAPANLSLAHNRYLLIVPVDQGSVVDIFKAANDAKLANEVFVSDGFVIPAGGYLVLTQGKADQSGVTPSPPKLADKKTAVQEAYNVKNELAFPYPGNDLEALFRGGGTIRLSHADVAANTPAAGAEANENGYLVSNNTYTAGSVVISEIMWGRDASLGAADATKSQWIELHNTTDVDISVDKSEWKLSFYQGGGGTAGTDVIDEVSNASPFWVAPGSSGATEAQRRVDLTEKGKAVPTTGDPIATSVFENFVQSTVASMYRKIDGTTAMSGTSADSWAASTTAGTRNLSGLRAGTPGAATPYTPPAPTPEPEPEPEPMAPAATAGDLSITEIMVASSSGRLPQWIEITNTSVGEVSLDGWMVGIDNDAADADVIAASLSITLDGKTLDAGQSLLVVSKTTNRNSGVAARSKGDDNAGALDSNRIVDASSQIKPASMTYSMLSKMSFRISLEPPLPLAGGVTIRGDVVGNLGGGWELPMSEAGRSSIIRREMGTAAEIMGTDAAGWMLASSTGLGGAYVATYYGDKDDMGTPGYDAGGALPVELSKFSAARDRVTGQVVITWETQSELNNAGFYIKRSQQRTSQFVAVNPTMVPGAGTTSEKQTYTYTDTTAQPNIVYYYQIEDVSLDGNRQTLTRAHRLRGHIGAAGKATTTWGELKSSRE